MSRSLKKGPFLSNSLLDKVTKMTIKDYCVYVFFKIYFFKLILII